MNGIQKTKQKRHIKTTGFKQRSVLKLNANNQVYPWALR